MKNLWILSLFLIALTELCAQGYKVGDVAEDFSLKNIDENYFSLADIQDAQGYIIIFTCNHCPFAVKYEDRIIALHHEMAPKGWPVVAINPNNPDIVPEDSFEAMQVRAKEKSFPFAYLIDQGQDVYPKFGATKTPHVFLLDKNLVVRYMGAIDDNYASPEDVSIHYVRNAIQAIQKGQDIIPSTTKAIGCSIKR